VIKAFFRGLLLNAVFIFQAPLWSLLEFAACLGGILLCFFFALRLVCSIPLANSGLTVCHPIPRNPICGIPYAHNVFLYCDPPRAPRPIVNGSAYFDIPNNYTKIFNASEDAAHLPDTLAYQVQSTGQFTLPYSP
jgi:hypothetical protein